MSSQPAKQDITNEIRNSIDFVELVGEHVALTRRGRTYKGLCPFHDDRNPSFDVDPERQRYRCWSCGAHGDLFQFVMDVERIGFREALELLAQRAGIELPARMVKRSKKDQGIPEVLDWAANEYANELGGESGKIAREYLAERGVSQQTVDCFGLGFVPNEWEWLVGRARVLGTRLDLLERAGLALRRRNGRGFCDRLRGRVVFPIRDVRGLTIGFGGRILPCWSDQENAKYLNSPETPVFSKGDQLYGLDRAKDEMVRQRVAIVVEGYTDCIMAHQWGATNVVATLGTALGEKHVRLLKRFVDRIVLVYDADEAGMKAADRALGLFLKQEADLRVLALPEGLDPCDYLTERGVDGFRKLVSGAVDALEFKLSRAERQFDWSTAHGRRQGVETVLETIAMLPMLTSGNTWMSREIMLDRVASRAGISLDVVKRLLSEKRQTIQRTRADGSVDSAKTVPVGEEAEQREDVAERELLEVLLADLGQAQRVDEAIVLDDFQSTSLRAIYQAILAVQRSESEPTLDRVFYKLNDRALVSRASDLAAVGAEKGSFDRRLTDVLSFFFERRKSEKKTELRQRRNALAGNEEAERALLEKRYQLLRHD